MTKRLTLAFAALMLLAIIAGCSKPPDAEIQAQAIRTWASLRLRLWYAWAWQLQHKLSKGTRHKHRVAAVTRRDVDVD